MRRTLLLILILALQFFVLFYEAKYDSATTDENVHLPAGYTYLKFHDFRFNPEHPPLQKMLVAIPLMFQKINLPDDFNALWSEAGDFKTDTWKPARQFGEELLYSSGNNADQMILSGRLMTIMLTLTLTVAVYVISKSFWGTRGGLLSATLVAFEPIMLAHGKLTNTDISVTLFFLLSVWWMGNFFKKPNIKNTFIFGFLMGLLQLSKYTAIIFYPIAFVGLILWLYTKKFAWKKELKKLFLLIILALAVHWVIITLAYFPHIKFFYAPDYIKGLVLVLGHVASGHSSFLMGEFNQSGWWYYFPLALVMKTSLISLVLLLGLMIVKIKRAFHFDFSLTLFSVSAIIFLLFSMTSKANLGARHLLAIYPLVFVLLGFWGYYISNLKIQISKLHFKIKNLIILLIILFMLESLAVFPFHITYFSSLVGTTHGYQYLLDSNYDWGQELKRIKIYQTKELKGEKIYLDYWWDGDEAPAYYNIKYERLTPKMKDVKGIMVIGATSYMNKDYGWIRELPISSRIGNGVFVIDTR